MIRAVGVDLRCNTAIGKDISLSDLREGNDAVLLGLGLQLGRSTRIPGSEHPDVRKAVDLLRQATAGEDFGTPRQAVVIGGAHARWPACKRLTMVR